MHNPELHTVRTSRMYLGGSLPQLLRSWAVAGIAGYVIGHSVGVNSGSGGSLSVAATAPFGTAVSQAGVRMGDAIVNVAASVPGSKPSPVAQALRISR